MRSMNRLGMSLVLGGLAAAGLFVIQLGVGPLCSGQGWTAAYWILCTIGLSSIGATHRAILFRRLILATLGAVGVLASWSAFVPQWHLYCGDSMSLLVMGLTIVFGGVRSGLLDASARLNRRRALCAEGVLGFAALFFAFWLAGPAPWEMALSFWGYVLIQSMYGCIPRSFLESERTGPLICRSTSSPSSAVDPFETAFAQLELMLGEKFS